MPNSRSIIVTGGAGFIGSNLVRLLMTETDYRVVVIDKLTYAGNLTSLTDLRQNDRLSFHKVDICDSPKVREIFTEHHPCGVMHLAAESHVDRSIDAAADFVQTNVVGTFVMLEEARHFADTLPEDEQARFRFLHVSTDEVYGSLEVDDPPFSETTPYNPHSPYSATKASADHLARAWFDTHRLPVIVTNCSNNYGPHQFPEKLIPVVILKALRDEPIPVYGKGKKFAIGCTSRITSEPCSQLTRTVCQAKRTMLAARANNATSTSCGKSAGCSTNVGRATTPRVMKNG